MSSDRAADDSQLFLVRVWMDRADNAAIVRGKVQHIASGQAALFSAWSGLRDVLDAMLARFEVDLDDAADNSTERSK